MVLFNCNKINSNENTDLSQHQLLNVKLLKAHTIKHNYGKVENIWKNLYFYFGNKIFDCYFVETLKDLTLAKLLIIEAIFFPYQLIHLIIAVLKAIKLKIYMRSVDYKFLKPNLNWYIRNAITFAWNTRDSVLRCRLSKSLLTSGSNFDIWEKPKTAGKGKLEKHQNLGWLHQCWCINYLNCK